jgi:hypothetical protein
MATPAKAQPAKFVQPATSAVPDDETTEVEPSSEELEAFREYQRRNASPEAQTMLAQGAAPVGADVQTIIDQMQAQILAQQEQVASLMQERGIPADPVQAAATNLAAHVAARAAAMPTVDFTELKDELGKDSPDPEVVTLLVADLPVHPELDYLAQLARDHSKAVLKGKKEPVKSGAR